MAVSEGGEKRKSIERTQQVVFLAKFGGNPPTMPVHLNQLRPDFSIWKLQSTGNTHCD